METDKTSGPYIETQKEYAEKFQGLNLEALAKELLSADAAKEKLHERHTKAVAVCDLLRYKLIPEEMERQNLQTAKYKSVGRISLTPDLLVSIKVGAKEALFAWFRKSKLGSIIQPGINPSTLRAFVKDRIQKGKSYPSDHLNVTPVTRASITKGA